MYFGAIIMAVAPIAPHSFDIWKAGKCLSRIGAQTSASCAFSVGVMIQCGPILSNKIFNVLKTIFQLRAPRCLPSPESMPWRDKRNRRRARPGTGSDSGSGEVKKPDGKTSYPRRISVPQPSALVP